MTSDGIHESDWKVVNKYACEICSISANDLDDTFAKKKLIKYLKKLETQYGRLPSILSTQADYVNDVSQYLSLNKEAYMSASEINDIKNMSLISGSISEFYVDELDDLKRGKYWFSLFLKSLEYFSDEILNDLKNELIEKLDKQGDGVAR